jgi:hypothetical protein
MLVLAILLLVPMLLLTLIVLLLPADLGPGVKDDLFVCLFLLWRAQTYGFQGSGLTYSCRHATGLIAYGKKNPCLSGAYVIDHQNDG